MCQSNLRSQARIVLLILLGACCVYIAENASVSVRLSDGPGRWKGRLEIYYNGVWGTVCDDGFDAWDGNIVCRSLGYADAELYNPVDGSGKIWLESVHCAGSEDQLDECDHSPWGEHDCQHYEDVGLECQHPKLQLASKTHRINRVSGRIEILHENTWGTVCDDGFDTIDARVACKQLGYDNGDVYNFPPPGSGPIYLNSIRCDGSEKHLTECDFLGISGTANCNHDEDAGVHCWCSDGTKWGHRCRTFCGKCSGDRCSPGNGHCSPCSRWYATSTCTEHIAQRNLTKDVLDVYVIATTALIEFHQVSVAYSLRNNYYHEISYQSLETNVKKKIKVPYDTKDVLTSVKLDGLDPVANYSVSVIPYRQHVHYNLLEAGHPSLIQTFETDCQFGFWSSNCSEVCGSCSSGGCALRNGHCKPPICNSWYVPPTCVTPIKQQNLTEDGLDVKVIDLTAQIQFHQVNITADLANYYYYIASYKSLKTNVITEKNISYYNAEDGPMSVVLDALDPVSNYTVKVIPYRHDVHNGLHEAGHPSREKTFETGCQPGLWGSDCTEVCGNCSSERCAWKNGHCKPPVCDSWYVPPTCVTPIKKQNLTEDGLDVKVIGLTAQIQFHQAYVEDSLKNYYYHVISYQSLKTNVITEKNVSYDTENIIFSVELEELDPVSNYTVKVIPFRNDIHYGLHEAGHPSLETTFETDCQFGFWNSDCSEVCGNCSSQRCAWKNGHCKPPVCDSWYVPPTCVTPITKQKLTKDDLDVKVIDLTAQIQFHQVNVTADLASYYYYIVSYKSLVTNVITDKNISYNTANGLMSVVLDVLDPVSNYTVKVIPYRHDVHNGLHEAGHPSREKTFETGCQPGFWSKASNCTEVCGNCSSERCAWKNGHCKPPVCDSWYVPPMCVTPIMIPNMSDHKVNLEWVTFHSAKIQFQQLILDVEALAPFYYYNIEYYKTEEENAEPKDLSASSQDVPQDVPQEIKQSDNGVIFYKTVLHDMSVDTPSSIIEGLQPNTNYTVKIVPYRKDMSLRGKGESTVKELTLRTDCKPGWFGGGACNTQCSDHCRLGQCDRYTGYCTCDIWYVPPLCKHFIANPDGRSKTMSISSSTTTKVQIQFQQLSLNDFIDDYYYYDVQYKEPGGSFKEAKVLLHRKEESLVYTTIRGLEAGKDYAVRVVPFRRDLLYKVMDAGSPTSDVAVTTQCPEGTFGFTCIKKCHCQSGPCDVRTGICKTPGCKNWWTLDNCTLPIREPNMTENNLTVLSESDTSLDVSFEALYISDNLSAFYGYSVQYNVSSGGNNMTVDDNNDREVYYNNVTVHHDNSSMLNVTIAGLEPNSSYIIRVLPFRMDLANDLMETGLPTPVISADTTPKSALTGSGDSGTAIAGSIIGCLLVVALVAGAVFVKFYLRDQKFRSCKKDAKYEPQEDGDDGTQHDTDQEAVDSEPEQGLVN